MKNFILHLEKNGYVEKSIQRAVYCAEQYESWLQSVNLKRDEASYKDLLNYIGHLQHIKKSKPVINEHLRSISLYYQYLQLPDIAYQVRVRGEEKKQHVLFSEEELDKLYRYFESRSQKGYWRYSDKIILGLIVYQALDTRDIYRLELDHLNLKEGKLYIPEGIKRKTSRTLKLEPHQVIPLHEYIQHHRDNSTEKLFSPQCSLLERLQGQLKDLFRQVREQAKEINLHVDRFNQVRQSRVTLWIKQHGLRKTQYMAGFKRVENVERYRQQDTEDLRQFVLQFHPLK